MRLGLGLSLPAGRFGAGGTLVSPGYLGSPMTLTRTGAATAFAADGTTYDVYAANTPRYNGPARRLLIEGARTNLLLNSATLATQSVTVTAVAHTLSFRGTGSVTLSGTSSGTTNGTGALDRVAVTFTPTAGSLTLTVAGSVTEAQLEIGASGSSYIPTTGAAVARGVDVVTGTASALGIPGPFTALMTVLLPQNAIAGTQTILNVDDGTTNNRVLLDNPGPAASTAIRILRSTAAAAASNASAASYTVGTLFRIGVTLDGAGRFAMSFNGAAPVAITGAPTSGLTRLVLGSNTTNGGNLFGEIGALRVLAGAISDADLAAAVAALA